MTAWLLVLAALAAVAVVAGALLVETHRLLQHGKENQR